MKTTAILLALLVFALPALVIAQAADTGNGDDSAVTEDTGLEGGSDVDIASSSTRPVIHALGVLGKGIAVSPDDPMDFMLVKIGLGAVKVTIDGEVRKAAVGVLVLDGERYRLRSVSVADGEAKGDIYQNGTKVGGFSADSVQKNDVEIWAGTMNLDGNTYHLYIIAGARRIKATELRDKVSEYCKNNPDDTNCREKVAEFCQNNPEDARCKALFRRYCIAGRNMDDVRCREYVKDYCEDNPSLAECVTLGVKRARAYCEKNQDSELCRKLDDRLVNFCKNNPDNEGCIKAKEVLQNRAQALNRIKQYVTKNKADIMSQVKARLVNTRLVNSGEA